MDILAHGRRKYPNSRLLLSSANRGWSGIAAELRSHPRGSTASPPVQTLEVAVGICGGNDAFIARLRARRQDRWSEGSVWLAPIGAEEEEVTVTSEIPQVLHLYLPIRPFNLLADQHNLSQSPLQFMQRIGGFTDELIRQIGLSLLAEINEETATGCMLAETSSLLLAARLCQKYADGSFGMQHIDTTHSLDNRRLRRVLDHIEEHLDDEITVSCLAGLAHLSVFHFSRMFAARMGMPPHRYVSRRRLECAMTMLAAGKLPLSEIAYRSCFSSQASFNRAFRRAVGMTPGEYRRHIR